MSRALVLPVAVRSAATDRTVGILVATQGVDKLPAIDTRPVGRIWSRQPPLQQDGGSHAAIVCLASDETKLYDPL